MKITLIGYNDNRKIHAIKALRSVTGYGLKESKDIVDNLPQVTAEIELLPGINLAEAMRTLDEGSLVYKNPNRWTVWRAKVSDAWARRPRLTDNLPALAKIEVPVFVTRPTSSGMIFSLSANGLLVFGIWIVLLLNAILWPLIGLYEAARVIFG